MLIVVEFFSTTALVLARQLRLKKRTLRTACHSAVALKPMFFLMLNNVSQHAGIIRRAAFLRGRPVLCRLRNRLRLRSASNVYLALTIQQPISIPISYTPQISAGGIDVTFRR